MVKINQLINKIAINTNGVINQYVIAMEECSEYQKALSKLIRYRHTATSDELTKYRSDLIEEFADLLICMDQEKHIDKVLDTELQDVINYKQTREAHRLGLISKDTNNIEELVLSKVIFNDSEVYDGVYVTFSKDPNINEEIITLSDQNGDLILRDHTKNFKSIKLFKSTPEWMEWRD